MIVICFQCSFLLFEDWWGKFAVWFSITILILFYLKSLRWQVNIILQRSCQDTTYSLQNCQSFSVYSEQLWITKAMFVTVTILSHYTYNNSSVHTLPYCIQECSCDTFVSHAFYIMKNKRHTDGDLNHWVKLFEWFLCMWNEN